jgi:glucose dehydrogenase
VLLRTLSITLLLTARLAACGEHSTPSAPSHFGETSEPRLLNVAQEPHQWFAPGRGAEGSYYCPLDAINEATAGRLGFAWEYPLGRIGALKRHRSTHQLSYDTVLNGAYEVKEMARWDDVPDALGRPSDSRVSHRASLASAGLPA